jgi:hypothetical protein
MKATGTGKTLGATVEGLDLSRPLKSGEIEFVMRSLASTACFVSRIRSSPARN